MTTSKSTLASERLFAAGVTSASIYLIGMVGSAHGNSPYRLLNLLGLSSGVLAASSVAFDVLDARTKRQQNRDSVSASSLPVLSWVPTAPMFPEQTEEDPLAEEILEPQINYKGRLRLTSRWPVPNPIEFLGMLRAKQPEVFDRVTRPEVIIFYPHAQGGMAIHIAVLRDLFPLASIASIHAVVKRLNQRDPRCGWKHQGGWIFSTGPSTLDHHDIDSALI